MRKWNQKHQIPILYVTHSREEVFAQGERVMILQDGKIVAHGTPHEVMTAPFLEVVAQLAGFENVFDAVVEAVRPVGNDDLPHCGRGWTATVGIP